MNQNTAANILIGTFPGRTISVTQELWWHDVESQFRMRYRITMFELGWQHNSKSGCFQIEGDDLNALVNQAVVEFPVWEVKVGVTNA